MIKKIGLAGLLCSLLAGGAVYGEEGAEGYQAEPAARCGKTTIGQTAGTEDLRGSCKPLRARSLSFQPAEHIWTGKACGWRSYRGTNFDVSPKLKITNLGEKVKGRYPGIRVEYTHPEDYRKPGDKQKKTTWIGIYNPFRSYDCGDDTGYRCTNLADGKGIEFLAHGNGKLRIQLTEGYEGCVNFGEAYEYTIDLTDNWFVNRWQKYQIPFSKFKFRKDWQMGEEEMERIRQKGINSNLVAEFMDCQLDLGVIQAMALEGLCRDNDKGCRAGEKRYFEIKDFALMK